MCFSTLMHTHYAVIDMHNPVHNSMMALLRACERTGITPVHEAVQHQCGFTGRWIDFYPDDDVWEKRKERDKVIPEFGFGLPSAEVLNFITKRSSGALLEVGAGTGFWSFLLAKKGCNVLATDWNNGEYGLKRNRFKNIKSSRADKAVKALPMADLLMVWPCMDTWAFDSAKELASGRLLYYIGEGYGGCTADSEFHTYYEDENVFEEVAHMCVPTWYGLNDYFECRRKL